VAGVVWAAIARARECAESRAPRCGRGWHGGSAARAMACVIGGERRRSVVARERSLIYVVPLLQQEAGAQKRGLKAAREGMPLRRGVEDGGVHLALVGVAMPGSHGCRQLRRRSPAILMRTSCACHLLRRCAVTGMPWRAGEVEFRRSCHVGVSFYAIRPVIQRCCPTRGRLNTREAHNSRLSGRRIVGASAMGKQCCRRYYAVRKRVCVLRGEVIRKRWHLHAAQIWCRKWHAFKMFVRNRATATRRLPGARVGR